MEIYRVTFFGHRTLTSVAEVEKAVEEMATELLRQKEFVEFYVGRNGDYDVAVASAIRRAQKTVDRQNGALILALPYPVKDLEYYESYYDEIVFPLEEKTHFKAAITKRNRWLVEHCDLVIACVQKTSGGAENALRYAQRLGKKVVNLGERLPRVTL